MTVKNRGRKAKMKNKNNSQKNRKPMLRFSPTAWAKLLFMRDMTDNEVAGFGITDADDLLFVKEFVTVKQKVTAVSFRFDDQAVGDLFEDQVDHGRKPEQFARIWLHTHPGDSPVPSITDEETFSRVFGNCDWSIICIVAQGGSTFAMLRFNVGPGGEVKIPVSVDYSFEFDAANFELWTQQYKANVSEDDIFKRTEKTDQTKTNQQQEIGTYGSESVGSVADYLNQNLLSEIEQMAPMERDIFMDELAVRSDFWDEEGEVFYE